MLNNQWTYGGNSVSPIPATPYILYVTSPVASLIGGQSVGCYTGAHLNELLSVGKCTIAWFVSSGHHELSLPTVYIAVPVVPQVVTYVNETDTLNLVCTNVITVSGIFVGQQYSWLDPHGNTISTSLVASLPSISRKGAGNYTCVAQLITNVNGVTNVTASTLVVVYCECPAYWGNMFLMFPLLPQTLPP